MMTYANAAITLLEKKDLNSFRLSTGFKPTHDRSRVALIAQCREYCIALVTQRSWVRILLKA